MATPGLWRWRWPHPTIGSATPLIFSVQKASICTRRSRPNLRTTRASRIMLGQALACRMRGTLQVLHRSGVQRSEVQLRAMRRHYSVPAECWSMHCYTSRFLTSLAWVWMKRLRGGTLEPMSMSKVRSAAAASSIVTCKRVLFSGSMVVSQS